MNNPSCKNCIFYKTMSSKYIGALLKKEGISEVIGECDNENVPNRLCVDYGMLCHGKYFEPICGQSSEDQFYVWSPEHSGRFWQKGNFSYTYEISNAHIFNRAELISKRIPIVEYSKLDHFSAKIYKKSMADFRWPNELKNLGIPIFSPLVMSWVVHQMKDIFGIPEEWKK